jgi:hypothetical protein
LLARVPRAAELGRSVAEAASVLLETLKGLEMSLHAAEVRRNVERLGALLHPSFREFGRSGASYTRAEILAHVSSQEQQPVIWAQEFTVEVLSRGIALLLYRSAHVSESGALHRHTNRASLWLLTDSGWKVRFHQGTPTQAFEKNAT